MARISGIRYLKDSKGKPTYAVINLKKLDERFADLLDLIEAEAIQDSADGEIVATHEEVVKMLSKKHGVKFDV